MIMKNLSKFKPFLENIRSQKNSDLIDIIMEGFEYIYHPDHDDPNPYAASPAYDKAESVFNSFRDRQPQHMHISPYELKMVDEICITYNIKPEDIKQDYLINHQNETPLQYLTRILHDPEVNEFKVNVRYVEDDHEYEGKFPAKYRDDKDVDTQKRGYDNSNAM